MNVPVNRRTLAAVRRTALQQIRTTVRMQLAEIQRRRRQLSARRRAASRVPPPAERR